MRKTKIYFSNFFLAPLVTIVLACGTTYSVHDRSDQSSNSNPQKAPFTSVVLVVKSDIPGSEEDVRLLDRFLSTEFILRRKQLVESNGDIRVEAVIKRLEKVSQTSRLWWGSLAGSAGLRVEVMLTRQSSDITNFTLDTHSQGASSTGDWWSGHGGSTEDMLQRSAVKIVDEIL